VATSSPRLCVLAAFAALLAWSGCGAPDASAPRAPQQRSLVRVKWSLLWRAGGAEQDSVLLYPNGLLAADSGQVYVPDPGGFRVAAFRVSDGSLAWTFGRRGQGPGEFRSFIAIVANPAGEIIVADRENARLTVLGRDGSLRREIVLPEGLGIESFCTLRNGEYLISTGQSGPRPLIRLSDAGTVLARYDIPWKALREAPAIQRQMFVAGAGPDACVLALKLGQGFSVYRSGQFSPVMDYVEALELPRVEVLERKLPNGGRARSQRVLDRRIGPAAVTAVGDTIVMPFVGETSYASRIIDLYRAAPAGYVHSYLLPWRVDAALRLGDVHYVLRQVQGHPTLIALRMSAEADSAAAR
jgi:hypothetical protein